MSDADAIGIDAGLADPGADFLADPVATEIRAVLRVVQAGDIALLPQLLNDLAAGGIQPADEAFHPVLVEAVCLILKEFQADGRSRPAHAAIDGLRDDIAAAAANVLLHANFPSGDGDLATMNEAGLLALACLLSAAGRHPFADAILTDAVRRLNTPAVIQAAFHARCRERGCAEEIAGYWREPLDGSADAARLAIAESPLNPAPRRVLARHLLEAGKVKSGLNALAVALALPVDDDVKLAFAEDLAVIVPLLQARGDGALLERDRVRWAISACPPLARRALALTGAFARDGYLPFLDADGVGRAEAYFSALLPAAHDLAPARVITPFPLRGGKPHLDVVWLEITDFCNQKCSFCPDPFREAPRRWQKLEQVKTLIDQLADTVSVGSMQLNAYGEPLLHPDIAEILGYIREKKLPFPTFFTSHGLTLVDKKLQQLSNNYPQGIAISLHNDSQESYAATRSAKIGDYDTLVQRVGNLLRQMVNERAACHMRLYQMVCNGQEDKDVDEKTRGGFPGTLDRYRAQIRSWEQTAAQIAAAAPPEARAVAMVNPESAIEASFRNSWTSDNSISILRWATVAGGEEHAFISSRPVSSYANLLLEYDPAWQVNRQIVNKGGCHFTETPSLAIFASGRLGICCLDMNSTATFGALADYGSLRDAVTSPEAMRMFAQISNGVATSRGCQICLGSSERVCRP